jgi:putative ABC transport system ATP-binding protein
MDLFHDLHRRGRTILLVTHDAEKARSAQRIIYVKDGLVEREEDLG